MFTQIYTSKRKYFVQGCSTKKKRCGNAPKKPAILKQRQTHFEAKHGKGVGTPIPSVPV